MADKEAKPKVYFGCLPKEQVLQFFETFKKALEETPKSEEKKNMEFEIKGTNEDLKGMCFETHNIEKAKFKEYFDTTKDHLKKALFVFTVSFKVNNESDVKAIEELFAKMKPMFSAIPFVKKHPENYDLNLRTNGTQIFVDFTSIKGEFIEKLVDLGLDLSEYHKFDSYLKSGFAPEDFFNLPAEELSLKVIQFALSVKSESTGIRKIIIAAIQSLKGIKLTNAKFQKKLEEHIEKLNMLNAFVSLAFNFEFDAKELHGQGLAAASQTFLKGQDINKMLEAARTNFLGLAKNMILPLLQQHGLVDTLKIINCDDICLSAGWPKYENGLYHTIHLPGFTKAFVEKVLA